MTAQELISILSEVSPDTEIVTGTWNGKVDTYAVVDDAHVFRYDQIYSDFFGTPGAFDNRLVKIKSKDVVYLDTMFDIRYRQVAEDRRITWKMADILSMHRSKEWKKERIYKILTEFLEKN